jgi:phosphopantothenoylcysteine decarboxylase/phosphopantothenate--cysteine ligase
LACHWYGKGRLADLEEVMERIEDLFSPKDLKGERILVTAGPTQEPIDPIRFITNRSSGKMGYALAGMARRRGADVILISGPTSLSLPRRDMEVVQVQTAEEMREAVLRYLERCSVVIKAAAVGDFRPREVSQAKIKKGESSLSLQLERTGDILEEIGKRKGDRILIGFAAETENLVKNAHNKLLAKNLDMIVANEVEASFGQDANKVKILFPSGEIEDVPLMIKGDVANVVLDQVVRLRQEKASRRP